MHFAETELSWLISDDGPAGLAQCTPHAALQPDDKRWRIYAKEYAVRVRFIAWMAWWTGGWSQRRRNEINFCANPRHDGSKWNCKWVRACIKHDCVVPNTIVHRSAIDRFAVILFHLFNLFIFINCVIEVTNTHTHTGVHRIFWGKAIIPDAISSTTKSPCVWVCCAALHWICMKR